MAGLIREAKGSVAFLVPLLGFSNHDSPQGYLYDPSLPPVFAEYIKQAMPEGVPMAFLPHHINDKPFAEAVIQQVLAFQKNTGSAGWLHENIIGLRFRIDTMMEFRLATVRHAPALLRLFASVRNGQKFQVEACPSSSCNYEVAAPFDRFTIRIKAGRSDFQ
jgi:hypothetical protein